MKWLKRILCFLLYVVIIACFAFLIYLFGFSKDEKIRSIVGTYFTNEKKEIEKIEVIEDVRNPPTAIAMPAFAEYDFFEVVETLAPNKLETLKKFYYSHNIEITLIDNGYGIEIGAYFTSANGSESAENLEKTRWQSKFNYPIATPPALLADAVVFITSDRNLHVLDLITGKILKEEKLPVYPSDQGILQEDGYYFKGRNGVFYKITLKQRHHDELFSEKGKDFSAFSLPQEITFDVNKHLKNEIMQRVLYWQPYLETVDCSSVIKLSPEYTECYLTLAKEPKIIAFTCSQQGEYTVGLTDIHNAWLTEKAYVAIFDNSANLLSVSMDYVADKPQVTVHLTENMVFYAVIGTLLEDVITQDCKFKMERVLK